MTISAGDFADTLKLLLPGFVCMKVFYQLGLRTKRSDAQWALWSILVAAPIQFVAGLVPGLTGASSLLVAIPLAIILGSVLALFWREAVARFPELEADQAIHAWDVVFERGARWLQIQLTNELSFSGWPLYVARSVDTDDLDLLLGSPKLIRDGQSIALPEVESILIRRAQIMSIAVFKPSDADASS